jgi:hypothetical protein
MWLGIKSLGLLALGMYALSGVAFAAVKGKREVRRGAVRDASTP